MDAFDFLGFFEIFLVIASKNGTQTFKKVISNSTNKLSIRVERGRWNGHMGKSRRLEHGKRSKRVEHGRRSRQLEHGRRCILRSRQLRGRKTEQNFGKFLENFDRVSAAVDNDRYLHGKRLSRTASLPC